MLRLFCACSQRKPKEVSLFRRRFDAQDKKEERMFLSGFYRFDCRSLDIVVDSTRFLPRLYQESVVCIADSWRSS
jgi:hypothetical protein